MRTAAVAGVLIAAAIVGCASGTSSSRAAANTREELALEVVATSMSRERWDQVLGVLMDGMIQIRERQAVTEGKQLPPNFRRIVAETTAKAMPYEEVAAFMASSYVRYFTEEDLRVILAYQRTPTFQKQVQLTPKLIQEGMDWAQRAFNSRKPQIQATIAARLEDKGR